MTTAATRTDARGNPLSTRSETAADAYDQGVELFLSGNPGADEKFERAIKSDDAFALAHVALARSVQRSDPERARELLSAARDRVAGTTKQEQRHIAALAEPDPKLALSLALEHLRESPSDALVLGAAQFMRIFSGQNNRTGLNFEMIKGCADAYAEDDWWFLSTRAFAHHETFRLEEARSLAQRSIELMPTNFSAAHSIAHVNEEADEAVEGDAFLDTWLDGKAREAVLFGHLSWHQALFKLWSGDYAGVIDLYQRKIGPQAERSLAFGTVTDSASLLWRLDLRGAEVELPWAELCDYIDEQLTMHDQQFGDLHCAFSYAASGREDQLGVLIDGLRVAARDGRIPAGDGVPAIAEGIAAFAAKDYDTAVSVMAPFEDEVERVGGSHAQWEVFEDTLLESYLRTEHFEAATALLQKRLDRRPSQRDMRLLESAGSPAVES